MITSRGPLLLDFFADEAPQTVTTFLRFVEAGYYEGGTFRRDEARTRLRMEPRRSEKTIPFERNARRHLIGSVAMTPTRESPVNGSFYICLQPLPERDGLDTLFGRVVRGYDTLARLRDGDILEHAAIVEKEGP